MSSLWDRARGDGARGRVPVTIRRRVHWGDTDSAQIGYTSALVDFAIEAAQYWWEAVLDQNWYRLGVEHGLGSPMVAMKFDFISPVRAGERVDLVVRLEKLGRASLTLRVEARHVERDEPVFTARLTSSLVDRAGHRAEPFPEAWRARIEGHARECELAERGVRSIDEVQDFWFGLPDAPDWGEPRLRWFGRDENLDPADFDREIAESFTATHAALMAGELDHWVETPSGALAAVLVLDQFSRHIFRDTAQAYASDEKARGIAKKALDAGFEEGLPPPVRAFFYLPLEHSEALCDQQRSLTLFGTFRGTERGDRQYQTALRHHEIIERFGRFPHRNAVLGRESTAEELAFLETPNSSFGSPARR